MLLPVLAKAKEKAHRIQCTNNQRQLLLSHLIYLGDFNDKIEPPNSGDSSSLAQSFLPAGWLYKPGEALPGIPGPNQTNGPSKGLFYPAMKNWSMYMCPLHRTNTPAWKQSAVKFTSYLMNGCIIKGSGSFDWAAGAFGKTYSANAFKATDMLL